MRRGYTFKFLSVGYVVAICLVAIPWAAKADRIVLAPTGRTLTELTYNSELAVGATTLAGDYGWLAYSSGDGIEMELSRFETSSLRKKQWAMSIGYPLPTLRDLPAISVGVKDITGTGVEHGAFYLAATKNVLLSKPQRRHFRSINISFGAGTGPIGGAFVGVDTRLKLGPTLTAEIYRHRPDFGIGIPLMRNLQIKAYSLNGALFYGASYHFIR